MNGPAIKAIKHIERVRVQDTLSLPAWFSDTLAAPYVPALLPASRPSFLRQVCSTTAGLAPAHYSWTMGERTSRIPHDDDDVLSER